MLNPRRSVVVGLIPLVLIGVACSDDETTSATTATPTSPSSTSRPTTTVAPATTVAPTTTSSTTTEPATTAPDTTVVPATTTVRADDVFPAFERTVIATIPQSDPTLRPVARLQSDGSLLALDTATLVLSHLTPDGVIAHTITVPPADDGGGPIDLTLGPDDIAYLLTGPLAGSMESEGQPVTVRAFDLAGDGTPLATWQPEATCGGLCSFTAFASGVAVDRGDVSPAPDVVIPWVGPDGAPSGATLDPAAPAIDRSFTDGPALPDELTTNTDVPPLSWSVEVTTAGDRWRLDLLGVDPGDGGAVVASGQPDGGAALVAGFTTGELDVPSRFVWIDLLPDGGTDVHLLEDDLIDVVRTSTGRFGVASVDGGWALVALA